MFFKENKIWTRRKYLQNIFVKGLYPEYIKNPQFNNKGDNDQKVANNFNTQLHKEEV